MKGLLVAIRNDVDGVADDIGGAGVIEERPAQKSPAGWENGASYNQSELSGALNDASSAIDGLMQYGMSHDQAVGTLTNIAYGQAVMLSTNQVFLAAAACFIVAAAAIWLAPRPARVANPAMAH